MMSKRVEDEIVPWTSSSAPPLSRDFRQQVLNVINSRDEPWMETEICVNIFKQQYHLISRENKNRLKRAIDEILNDGLVDPAERPLAIQTPANRRETLLQARESTISNIWYFDIDQDANRLSSNSYLIPVEVHAHPKELDSQVPSCTEGTSSQERDTLRTENSMLLHSDMADTSDSINLRKQPHLRNDKDLIEMDLISEVTRTVKNEIQGSTHRSIESTRNMKRAADKNGCFLQTEVKVEPTEKLLSKTQEVIDAQTKQSSSPEEMDSQDMVVLFHSEKTKAVKSKELRLQENSMQFHSAMMDTSDCIDLKSQPQVRTDSSLMDIAEIISHVPPNVENESIKQFPSDLTDTSDSINLESQPEVRSAPGLMNRSAIISQVPAKVENEKMMNQSDLMDTNNNNLDSQPEVRSDPGQMFPAKVISQVPAKVKNENKMKFQSDLMDTSYTNNLDIQPGVKTATLTSGKAEKPKVASAVTKDSDGCKEIRSTRVSIDKLMDTRVPHTQGKGTKLRKAMSHPQTQRTISGLTKKKALGKGTKLRKAMSHPQTQRTISGLKKKKAKTTIKGTIKKVGKIQKKKK